MCNFSKKNYPKWTLYEEERSRRSSLHSKNGRILNFELLPSIQNNLDRHENFTTVTLFEREKNPTNFIENEKWMKEIQGPKVAALKCSLVNSNWSCELWLASKNSINLGLIWKFYHTIEERAQLFQQVFIELGH